MFSSHLCNGTKEYLFYDKRMHYIGKKMLFPIRKIFDVQKLWTFYSFVNTMQFLMLMFIMLLFSVYFLTSNI